MRSLRKYSITKRDGHKKQVRKKRKQKLNLRARAKKKTNERISKQ